MSSLCRPLGTYLLAASAFYSQLQTNHHLTQMAELAASSAALSLSADTKLEHSFALQQQAATNSEEGLTYQAESVEHEANAAKMEVGVASEIAVSEEYISEAEALHEHSVVEASESTAYLSSSKELQLQSNALHSEAESNLAASTMDEEKSLADMAESVKAGEVATAAEDQAAEYEAVALRKEGQSIKDGEALLKTETGAMEDVEVMAACAPIPGLNIVCEAVGSVVEVGYQSIAAVEGAKAAVETIQGVTAAQKGRAEMILALRGHEEETRLVLEAQQFQLKADEEGSNAITEQAESEALIVEAKESEMMGNERAQQSEKDEAMAAIDKELAAEHEAKAARDEAIAVEEESSAISSQLKSDEMLSESTVEEMDAMAERAAAESEMIDAERLLQQSVAHGMRSLAFVLDAILTAGLVVYILLMRGLSNAVVPGLQQMWKSGRNSLSAAPLLKRLNDSLIHAGTIVGTILNMPKSLSNFDDAAVHSKARALMLLAVVAGSIESFNHHATPAMIGCLMKDKIVRPTLGETIQSFLADAAHSVPVILMESLIFVVIFGQGFFGVVFRHVPVNRYWIWCIVSLLGMSSLLIRKLRKTESILSENAGEHDKLLESTTSNEDRRNLDLEYGSVDQRNHAGHTTADTLSNGSSDKSSNCAPRKSIIQKCYLAVSAYFDSLRRWSDVLVLTIMIMLLWRCRPVLTVLHPLTASFGEMISAWVPLPCLIIVGLAVAVIVHILFVR